MHLIRCTISSIANRKPDILITNNKTTKIQPIKKNWFHFLTTTVNESISYGREENIHFNISSLSTKVIRQQQVQQIYAKRQKITNIFKNKQRKINRK